MMSKFLNVSDSGYYDWASKGISMREKENTELKIKIAEKFLESRFTYGSPRIYDDLKEEGTQCSENRVARLMREDGVRARFKKQYMLTTDSNHHFLASPNILNREFQANNPNQKWVSDITYIQTETGWMFLCVIMNLFSKKIVGWSLKNHMNTSLLVDAFLMAVTLRSPSAGLIFHSDRGVQYASREFRNHLERFGMRQSMSRKGNCWDNAPSESFFKTFKVEEVYKYGKLPANKVEGIVCEYIEGFYNIKRKHSSIKYLSPQNFELNYG